MKYWELDVDGHGHGEKVIYRNVLRNIDSETLLQSLANPSPGMRDIHIALHRIVLRERGALKK